MVAVACRKDADKGPDHAAAVFHEVEGNDGYDEEFDDRAGNDEDRLQEIGNAVDTVIADLSEGIVDDPLDLVRNVKLGLFIFKLHDQICRPID